MSRVKSDSLVGRRRRLRSFKSTKNTSSSTRIIGGGGGTTIATTATHKTIRKRISLPQVVITPPALWNHKGGTATFVDRSVSHFDDEGGVRRPEEEEEDEDEELGSFFGDDDDDDDDDDDEEDDEEEEDVFEYEDDDHDDEMKGDNDEEGGLPGRKNKWWIKDNSTKVSTMGLAALLSYEEGERRGSMVRVIQEEYKGLFGGTVRCQIIAEEAAKAAR